VAETEEQLKKAAELKLWLENRIAELQEEMVRLRETLALVDATLSASTFKPAIELVGEIGERREIKRDKGGQVVATATVTSQSVVIEPSPGITLRSSTPPFKSFLLGKILQGMKSKDEELVSSGKLQRGKSLSFTVEEDEGGTIRKITVSNYRDKARLTEILNTVSWTFSRMLEK
jgi:hypothetical protein